MLEAGRGCVSRLKEEDLIGYFRRVVPVDSRIVSLAKLGESKLCRVFRRKVRLFAFVVSGEPPLGLTCYIIERKKVGGGKKSFNTVLLMRLFVVCLRSEFSSGRKVLSRNVFVGVNESFSLVDTNTM